MSEKISRNSTIWIMLEPAHSTPKAPPTLHPQLHAVSSSASTTPTHSENPRKSANSPQKKTVESTTSYKQATVQPTKTSC